MTVGPQKWSLNPTHPQHGMTWYYSWSDSNMSMRLLEKTWHIILAQNSKSASQQVNNRVSNPDKPKECSKDLVSSQTKQADLACPVLLNNSILCYLTYWNHRKPPLVSPGPRLIHCTSSDGCFQPLKGTLWVACGLLRILMISIITICLHFVVGFWGLLKNSDSWTGCSFIFLHVVTWFGVSMIWFYTIRKKMKQTITMTSQWHHNDLESLWSVGHLKKMRPNSTRQSRSRAQQCTTWRVRGQVVSPVLYAYHINSERQWVTWACPTLPNPQQWASHLWVRGYFNDLAQQHGALQQIFHGAGIAKVGGALAQHVQLPQGLHGFPQQTKQLDFNVA